MRKTIFGSDSAAGSLFVSRLLTVVASLQLQKCHVLDFLVESMCAARNGHSSPSLLPKSSSRTATLGEPIQLTKLEPSELTVDPIRAGTLIFLESASLILQVEFQTESKADIPFRMLDYRVRGFRRFPDKDMRQIVIYLHKQISVQFGLSNRVHFANHPTSLI